MFNIKLLVLLTILSNFTFSVAFATPTELLSVHEIGSYVNPNPRPYKKCNAQDLVTLSGCCNDALVGLNVCKADDLACECCALQSIKQECYSLCPGNPSANFLSVLMKDCASLNDVNACSLPFKKIDDDLTLRVGSKAPSSNFEQGLDATISSRVTVKHVANLEEAEHRIELLFDYDQFSEIDANKKETKTNEVGKSMNNTTFSNSTSSNRSNLVNASASASRSSKAYIDKLYVAATFVVLIASLFL